MTDLITLEEIEAARAVLPSQVRRTPILPFSRSSEEVSREELFLKLENHQPMGAYKVRASFYLLMKMSPEERARGVVLGSSGNFAQGFAYAGRELEVKVAVVMMKQVSPYKVEAVHGFGGEVVFCENDYLARQPKVEEISRERCMVAVDTEGREAMIGHSSLGLEIIEDMPDVDTVVTPVAAGGLLGSVASAIKLKNSRVRVIGAQPEGAPAMSRSFKAGEPVTVEHWQTMCDALSSTRPGDVPFQHVKEFVDDIVLVSEEEIADAFRALLIRGKILAEPAGAVPVAAFLAGKIHSAGKIVAVISGGNLTPELASNLMKV